jgi:hypothetical protein
MPSVGFELTIPVFERAKIVHALDSVTTVIGTITDYRKLNIKYFIRFMPYFMTTSSELKGKRQNVEW